LAIEYEPLRGRPAGWEELIGGYATKTLFHHEAWLDHVLDIHPAGRLDYFRIRDGSATAGYHVGLRIKKGPLPIHGSPLGGTGTNFMGPLVSGDADQEAVVRGLVRLAGVRRFLHLEVSNPWLRRPLMEKLGFGVQHQVTHLVPLPATEDEAWGILKSTARNRIRKAQKQGIIVEEASDEGIVDEFFDQFTEVYGKQRMVTPFGPERPRSLWRRLSPAGRLLAIRIREGDTVLATGLFPFDERCIYFWGAASWLRHQHLNPNELLHWEVIRFAVRKGIPAYNMCGGASQFKDKFGGEDVPYDTFFRSFVPGLARLREWYRRRHYSALRKAR
jgi:hypothetical protein